MHWEWNRADDMRSILQSLDARMNKWELQDSRKVKLSQRSFRELPSKSQRRKCQKSTAKKAKSTSHIWYRTRLHVLQPSKTSFMICWRFDQYRTSVKVRHKNSVTLLRTFLHMNENIHHSQKKSIFLITRQSPYQNFFVSFISEHSLPNIFRAFVLIQSSLF